MYGNIFVKIYDVHMYPCIYNEMYGAVYINIMYKKKLIFLQILFMFYDNKEKILTNKRKVNWIGDTQKCDAPDLDGFMPLM